MKVMRRSVFWGSWITVAALVAGACTNAGSGGAGGTGGGSAGPPAVCVAFVSCVSVTDAASFGQISATYGAAGTCWKGSALEATQCETACKTGLQTTLEGYDQGGAPKECLAGMPDQCLQVLECQDGNGAWAQAVSAYGPAGTCWAQEEGACALLCACELFNECGGSGDGCNQCSGNCITSLDTNGPVCSEMPASLALYNALVARACGSGGQCATECAETYCAQKAPDSACTECLYTNCAAEFKACQNDS